MAISALVVTGVAVGASAVEARKARKSAERQAELERQQIEAMQREIQAEANKSPMPTPDDAAARSARRRSIAGMSRRRGRASTILTGDTGTGDALGQ